MPRLVGWGALTQARQALIQSLRERAERAEAEQDHRVAEARAQERARIAREMHDVLAHRLSLLATYSGAMEYRPDSSPEQLSRAAGVIRTGAHQALDELRQVITLLREDEPDDGLTLQPPQPGLSDLYSPGRGVPCYRYQRRGPRRDFLTPRRCRPRLWAGRCTA